jgi:hypothetical protein
VRITIAGHGITLETADEWVVPSGWDDASLQATHGVYLLSTARGVQFHVRSSRSLGGDVTLGSLLRELHEQNANAALPGTRAEVAAARDAAERLLSTLRFQPTAQ